MAEAPALELKAHKQTSGKFELDNFQKEAIEAINSGKSVLVCAPTGAGKTVIAKEAITSVIKSGGKAFYTAPLKALINQKYLEFCQEYGEDKVGIITGDTNKNRDAQIIVMTTEIYRNMLYGTSFGSVDPYLEELKFVIFDEFHYMNDKQRGTVWEESIVYSPKSIQLIGLSATVNNPEEIIKWIEDIHGECALVQTHKRPVPLFHYYFKEGLLAPLLTTNGKLNPQLKERNDNRFGKKRNNKHNRNLAQEKKFGPASVVEELSKKNMLPAIYFVFSRKGCNIAAEQCSELNLLNATETEELNRLIDETIALSSSSHVENHKQLELLRRGVASHHAGLLPQWKSLVEELFAKGLVKVVFSTETLAAGINMPARATVISTINKISDEGHRNLRASEFLQMSGRAGRRGMDEHGYVITVKNGNETAGEVAAITQAKAEDVNSHFSSSYEMVLNLLQNHSIEEVKDLIQKSFGQSQANKTLEPLKQEAKKLEERIIDLQTPLCPGDIGDLTFYKGLQEKIDQTRAQKKKLEKQMSSEVSDYEEALQIMTLEAQNYPCNGCHKQKPCSKQMAQMRRFRKQVKEINSEIADRKELYWEQFQNILDLLKAKKYIDQNNKPTDIGLQCAALRSDNSYFITEVLRDGSLSELKASDLAAAISGVAVYESRKKDSNFGRNSKDLARVFKQFSTISRRVIQDQRKFRIYKSTDVNPHFAPIVTDWASGMKWDELISSTKLDEGDVLKGIRRTIELVRQISRVPGVNPKIAALANESADLLEREPILDENL